MKIRYAVAAAALLFSTTAFAEGMLSSVPTTSKTVSDWYKQDVYDPQDNKIGKIDDVRVYNQTLSATDIFNLYRSGEVVRKVADRVHSREPGHQVEAELEPAVSRLPCGDPNLLCAVGAPDSL